MEQSTASFLDDSPLLYFSHPKKERRHKLARRHPLCSLYPRDLPSLIGHGRESNPVRHAHAIHVPDQIITGRGVAPKDIGLAIPVEVSRADDSPGLIRNGKKARPIGQDYPVHVPDHVFTSSDVAPEDICVAVIVKVPGADDSPGLIGNGKKARPTGQGYPVHVPDDIHR